MTKDELRQAREKLGMTQAEFAEALGICANTVARFERGELAIRRLTELAVTGLLVAAKYPTRGTKLLSVKDESPIEVKLRLLREEITRRRKANNDEYMKRRWNHEAIKIRDQSVLLDWIEDELSGFNA